MSVCLHVYACIFGCVGVQVSICVPECGGSRLMSSHSTVHCIHNPVFPSPCVSPGQDFLILFRIYMCVSIHVQVRQQPVGIGSVFPPCGSQT